MRSFWLRFFSSQHLVLRFLVRKVWIKGCNLNSRCVYQAKRPYLCNLSRTNPLNVSRYFDFIDFSEALPALARTWRNFFLFLSVKLMNWINMPQCFFLEERLRPVTEPSSWMNFIGLVSVTFKEKTVPTRWGFLVRIRHPFGDKRVALAFTFLPPLL